MEKFIKYCCLCLAIFSLSTVSAVEEHKEDKCPEGQVYDADLDACISADKAGSMEVEEESVDEEFVD